MSATPIIDVKFRLGSLAVAAGVCVLTVSLLPISLSAQIWNWHTEIVDQAGKFTSIASDKGGKLHLSYSDGQDIKYAFRPAGAESEWFTMSIDRRHTYSSFGLPSPGNTHICFTAPVL